ncbi:hypothetical protein ACFWUZ_21975 [Streptomyces sp. NPDC058646]|uniref:hypothetical protein n=1 Tax=Streptomyces sp. NPDC058646 TaxID=3346574 RepID=UPI003660C3D6
MSSPVSLSEGCLGALHHLTEMRDVNTVILRSTDTPGALVPDMEANLTHEELLRALPADEPRLVVHELAFATREGARRNEQVLIFWMPPGAGGQEAAYTVGYDALREYLADVRVHLTAGRTADLQYRRLVALAG